MFSPHIIILFIVVSILVIEMSIMMVLEYMPDNIVLFGLIDALLLIVFMTPVMYVFVYRPLLIHIRERIAAENELRTKEALLRQSALDSNPLTRLPGNNSITEAVKRAVETNEDKVVVYGDIDLFKPFNDKYGFLRGDEVILFTSRIISGAIESICCRENEYFLGHIGGDDFMFIVPASSIDEIANKIIADFDGGIASFYDKEDVKRGYIESINRRGEPERFQIMTLSMGGVALKDRGIKHYLDLVAICAQVKHKAKSVQKSNLYLEHRAPVRAKAD